MLVWSESILAWLAIVQTVIVTLRAGSRAWYLQRHHAIIGFVDGPVIQKPTHHWHSDSSSSDAFLWDLTIAVRQAVKLGLRINEYAEGYFYDVIRVPSESTTTKTPYRMSMEPSKDVDDGISKDSEETNEMYRQMGGDDGDDDDVEIVLQTALRHRTDPLPDDFETALITEYPINPNTMVRITAYAPNTFQSLRYLYHHQHSKQAQHSRQSERRQHQPPDLSFQRAMLDEPFVSYATNSKGAARTGGIFFFTQNGHYIVKTIKREEMQTLWNMLPRYTEYLKSRPGNASLLTRFLGLYKLEWKSTGNDNDKKDTSACYYIVIMNAVFPVGVSRHFSEMFDLKGSTVGRETSKERRENNQERQKVMKDLDLIPDYGKETTDRDSVDGPCGPLRIGSTAKSTLLVQLHRDVQFLEQSSVIDYSLLVGILTPSCRKNQFAIAHCQTWPRRCLAVLTAPFQAIMAPAIFHQSVKGFGHIPFSWPPLVPYYGSLQGGIDTGPLSCIGGERSGMPAIYFLGLIDFLQPYNYKKVLEYRAKSLVYEKDTYSCVPPTTYANRFLAFIDRCVS